MPRGPQCDDDKPHKLNPVIRDDRPELDCSTCGETWGVGNPEYRKVEDVQLPD